MIRLSPLLVIVLLLVMAAPARAATTLLETLTVSNTNPTPVVTTTSLAPDRLYRLEVSGEVSDWTTDPSGIWDGHAWGVDAMYCYHPVRCAGAPQPWRQFLVHGLGLDEWAGRKGRVPYAPNHVYSVDVTGKSGPLGLVMSDAYLGSAADNSGATTAKLYDLGPAPGSRITFSYSTYANNVRGLRPFQLGKAWQRGSGDFRGPAIFGLITDRDEMKIDGIVTMEAIVDGYSYTAAAHGVRRVLKLRVRVSSSTGDKYCKVGTRGTITLVDDNRKLRNGQVRDSVTASFPAADCPTHVQGWSNANNPNTAPTKGGTGQYARVTIRKARA